MRFTNHAHDLFIDANGYPAERMVVGGIDAIVHYGDIPESDITSVDGIACTTALRTVIDLASQLDSNCLALMICDCLDRGLFTLDEARARLSEPDMRAYPGARSLREVLRDSDGRT